MATACALVLNGMDPAAAACPCINMVDTPVAGVTDPCLSYDTAGTNLCYDKNYGFGQCDAHDQGLAPFCDAAADEYPGAPDWCIKSWCYVDPENCDVAFYPSAFFSQYNLYFSYEACGNTNSFSDWLDNKDSLSYEDIINIVEQYAIANKRAIEHALPQIDDHIRQASSLDRVELECASPSSCSCATCADDNCWGATLDTTKVNVIKSFEFDSSAVTRVDKVTLGCAYNTIETAFARVASREYNDNASVAYQYYGDQATGAMVQWPALEWCPTEFDARLRPWYAAAAAGPRDVVIVVDDSGSMSGPYLDLAKKAVRTVLRTLTWVDYVSVVSFDSAVKEIYSDTLVRATDAQLEAISAWANTKLVASGGTNFMEPLEKAYEILASSRDSNDRSTCQQLVLFLTDGDASFDQARMDALTDMHPDTVVFTYALGPGANSQAMHAMACSSGGVFYPVPFESDLPRTMASYYHYFAQQQNECDISWVGYADATTQTELIAACLPVYRQVENGTARSLSGVSCFDMNIVVSLAKLETCGSDEFSRFQKAIFKHAAKCPPQDGRPTECYLAKVREDAGMDVCPGEPLRSQACANAPPVQVNECVGLGGGYFADILIDECQEFEHECRIESFLQRYALYITVVVGTLAALAFCCTSLWCYCRGQNKLQRVSVDHEPTTPTQQVISSEKLSSPPAVQQQQHEQAQAQTAATNQPVQHSPPTQSAHQTQQDTQQVAQIHQMMQQQQMHEMQLQNQQLQQQVMLQQQQLVGQQNYQQALRQSGVGQLGGMIHGTNFPQPQQQLAGPAQPTFVNSQPLGAGNQLSASLQPQFVGQQMPAAHVGNQLELLNSQMTQMQQHQLLQQQQELLKMQLNRQNQPQ